jgi:hypothetical protein
MLTPEGRPRIDRQVLATKAEELDATIAKLTAMRDGLRHAAACPAKSYMECPTFRRLLSAAATGAIGRGDVPRRPRELRPRRRSGARRA